MSEQHPYRATIPSVSDGTSQPLWSVMIPTYNCANYLRETLVSVLNQDPGPDVMQIEVVDDYSTQDDPAAVVEELGRGRVAFYRQAENVGFIRNFETCLQRSRGKLIHQLHGDDSVRDGFYRKMQVAFQQNPEIGAAFCRHIYMDEHGDWDSMSSLEQPESGLLSNWLEKIAAGQRLATPSIVVRRDVYEKLGGFDRRMSCAGEDWEMWVRIAANYPVWYEVEPLAAYRSKRPGSLTEGSARTNKLVQDMLKATEIIESYLPAYLPESTAREVLSKARRMYAYWALSNTSQTIIKGDMVAASTQIQEALKCSCSFPIISYIVRLLLKGGAGWGWQSLRSGMLLRRENL